MQIKAILVDDQISANKVLENFIETYTPEIKIEGVFQSSLDALKSIKTLKPQIIFTDIDMPEIDGFELTQIINDSEILFVYVTGHPEKAIEAIRLSAFDFLNKPLSPNDLINCVSRAKEKLKSKSLNQNDSSDKLIINKHNSVVLIPKNEIYFIKALGQYTEIYHSDNKITHTTKPISFYNHLLELNDFIKANQSYIINKNLIEDIVKTEKTVIFQFNTTIKVEISKRSFSSIKEML